MIQNLARRTCVVQVSNFSWSSLLEELSNSGHQGVIYGAKKEVLSRFGVDAGDLYHLRSSGGASNAARGRVGSGV